MKLKSLILFACSLAFIFNLTAKDVIKLTWQGGSIKKITIVATTNEPFTIDWGDGSEIETRTGTGDHQNITHFYGSFDSFQATIAGNSDNCLLTWFYCDGQTVTDLDLSANINLINLTCYDNQLNTLDLSANIRLEGVQCEDNQISHLDLSANTALTFLACSNNQINTLDLSANTALTYLSCYDNQISSLDLSANTVLEHVTCYNNRLPLSDLYTVSKVIDYLYSKLLGTQTLVPQTVQANDEIDFSSQAKFEGIPTVFAVYKGSSIAITNIDYTIAGGIITFITDGNYTVIMTNDAIIADPNYPAKVIATFMVGDEVGITDVPQTPNILSYPNPTVGKVYIEIESNIKVYNMRGALLQETFGNQVDLSVYPQGVYLLQINEGWSKVVKQ